MDVLGRYQVEAEIGAGAFGAVYRARDPVLTRTVAIKLFHPSNPELVGQITSAAGDPVDVLRERFLREARIVQEQLFQAPHVVQILGFDVLEDGRPYYVMPYYRRSLRAEIGRDLTDPRRIDELEPEVRPRALGLVRGQTVLRQVALALSAIHRAGVVHRDLKPANVMVDGRGDVVLVDFGIAKIADPDVPHESPKLVLGTESYMAPEQRSGMGEVDARVDIFAWGVLAYRVLVGELPGGPLRSPTDFVPGLTPAMGELILRCLDPQRDARPADGAALLAAFDVALPPAREPSESSATISAPLTELAGVRDDLEPLRERIDALLLEHGQIPPGAWLQLEALGELAELERAALDTLASDRAEALRERVTPIRRFLATVDARLGAHGGVLPAPVLDALRQAGAAVGFDEDREASIIAARSEERAPEAHEPRASRSSPSHPGGPPERSSRRSRVGSTGRMAVAGGLVLLALVLGLFALWTIDVPERGTDVVAGESSREPVDTEPESAPGAQPQQAPAWRPPETVPIPAGAFRMGCRSGPSCSEDELPVEQISIPAFRMTRFEITFDDFDAFAEASGRALPTDSGWGRGRRPVINVTWNDAMAYAEWLSERTGRIWRLPSESEWEYAARAGTETRYPWGDDIGMDRANCKGCGSRWDGQRTAPVGTFAPNAFGLHDMIGNVWEWTADCWQQSHADVPANGEAREPDPGIRCGRRVLRGGAWNLHPRHVRVSNRSWNAPVSLVPFAGFRLVQATR
jgi:formylglycine-generating enzyme required for sulfatase activity/serine/threonine protein kinase